MLANKLPFMRMVRHKSTGAGLGTDTPPRLLISSRDSHLISIPAPGKAIGFGNSCDLYKGLYAPTQIILAMKRPRILEHRSTQAREVKRRYEREAKIWASLFHANILPFYGLIEISSEAYLVSPWMELGDLSKFTKARLQYLDNPLEFEERETPKICHAFSTFDEAATIHGIASGLAYLHTHNVIHGDLKAANVLLDDLLNPLICDFGLTKNDEWNVTSPGLKGSGTARWKSPGLTDDLPKTKKTDIYAFGMTIVEVLTGDVPFPNLPGSHQVYMAVAKGRRPPFEPLTRDGRNFKPLWELAASCWQNEADNRPAADDVLGRLAFAVHTDVVPFVPRSNDLSDVEDPEDLMDVASDHQEHISTVGLSGSSTPSDDCDISETMENTDELEQELTIRQISDDQLETATALRDMGERMLQEARYEDAILSLNDAFVLYTRLGDHEAAAECVRTSGDVLHQWSHLDDALRTYAQALEMFQELGDEIGVAGCLQCIGAVKRDQGLYDEAISSLNKAARMFKELDDWRAFAGCARITAYAFDLWDRLDHATSSYADACNIFQEMGDQTETADCHQRIAMVKHRQGLYSDAIESLSQASTIYEDVGNMLPWAECVRMSGEVYVDWSRFDVAISEYLEALSLFQELGNSLGRAACLRGLGTIRRKQGLYDDASCLLSEAFRIYEGLGHQRSMAECIQSSAQVFADWSRLEDAVSNYEASYKLFEQLGDTWRAVTCLGSLAEALEKQGGKSRRFEYSAPLAGALGYQDQSRSSGFDSNAEERPAGVMGQRIPEGLLGHSPMPEQLKFTLTLAKVRVANAYRVTGHNRKARWILLEASQLFHQRDEEVETLDSLMLLGHALLRADFIREALTVSEERARIQQEMHARMPLTDWLAVARQRLRQPWFAGSGEKGSR
ncbi:hypothetical protein FRB93_001210 [Tulasnella sp. JGI-2019a]|nr:hypothetical protein FRB93_001210 [Tulasnella sp. JGI-2019a]